MKYPLAKKAYEINFNKIDEGYLWSRAVSYAATRNKAKLQLLSEVDGAKLRYSDEDITYLNIPVVRCKAADKYTFEGDEMTLNQIESELTERERLLELDQILADKDIEYCYIRKGSFYRPNSCGYTDHKYKAGIYTKEEAVSHARSCRDISLVTIDINEHNQMIEKEIQSLEQRKISV